MFKSGQPNPYDEIVAKTTDENLTGENWELIITLCDKVNDEGTDGARNVIAAILKRLSHRNSNVQLYSLSLSESLSKNCGIELHRELASRAWTQALEKLITDRNTHEKVKKRALVLIEQWTRDFENDSTLGIMEECYNSLKTKGFKFEPQREATPPAVDDEVRRREEEELQRVLEMSIQDKGGRAQWSAFTGGEAAGSSSGAGPSSSTSGASSSTAGPSYSGGYVPARIESPVHKAPAPAPTAKESTYTAPTVVPQEAASPVVANASSPTPSIGYTTSATGSVVTRVRALHTFEPTEPGELGFEKGDIIKVVDRGYKDWWRGQLKGRTGIFPVNYVEPLPEPTANELAKEAEQEATVFSQAADVDKLLTMLRQLDPNRDNLADNEEIQELYRACMALRPKIVKLIDKYSQKRADLVSMNETFVRARTIFDRMMEESLARHSVYEASRAYGHYPQPGWGPYDQGQGPQPYGPGGYPGPAQGPMPGPGGYPQPVAGPQGFIDPNAYAQAQQPQGAPQPHVQTAYQQPYPPQPQGVPGPAQYQPQPGQPQVMSPGSYGQQALPPQQQQQSPHPQETISQQPQQQPQQYQTQPAQPQPTQPQPQPVQAQPQAQLQQTQLQPQPQQTQSQPQPQATQAQSPSPQRTEESGPPYAFDPKTTYADPNVQAWATYYAKGGTDTAGAVYFISVPGVKEEPAAAQPAVAETQQQPQPQQSQYQDPTAGAQTQRSGSYIAGARSTSPQVFSAGPASSTSPSPWGQPAQQPYGSMGRRPTLPNTPFAQGSFHAQPQRQGSGSFEQLSNPYDNVPDQGAPAQAQAGPGQGVGGAYYGLTQQFAGVQLRDDGPARTRSPQSGQIPSSMIA